MNSSPKANNNNNNVPGKSSLSFCNSATTPADLTTRLAMCFTPSSMPDRALSGLASAHHISGRLTHDQKILKIGLSRHTERDDADPTY